MSNNSPAAADQPVSFAAAARRARLSDRRRAGLRRRAVRMAARFGVLLAFDAGALYGTRSLLRWWADTPNASDGLLNGFDRIGPLASPGDPASMVFWLSCFVALVVTGSYSGHRALNTPLRVLGALVIAGIAATIPLAAVVGARAAVTQLSIVVFACGAGLVATRALAERFLRHVWPRERAAGPAVVMGSKTASRTSAAAAVAGPGGDYRIAAQKEVDALHGRDVSALRASVSELLDAHNAEAVVVTEDLPSRQLEAIVIAALDSGSTVLLVPQAVEIEDVRPRLVWHADQPFLEFATPGLQVAALLTKRVTDAIGALLLLVIVSPVMLLVALGVKLDSPGRVFFSQTRAGLGGRPFRMLKFRTMRESAEEEKKALAHLNRTGDSRLFKIPADPRVTRFGRFLRRWSLDELPQLWNVLRGDMSLVGPRPFFESDFETYEEHHFRRLDTKPGITGLWQVSGRSDVVSFEDVVFLDRQYIENWSFWLDMSILLRTIPSVLRRRGAY